MNLQRISKTQIRRPFIIFYRRFKCDTHQVNAAATADKTNPGKAPCRLPVKPKKTPIGNRADLKRAKRIMVKFGSSVILENPANRIAMSRLANLIEQLADLHNDGKEILFITSGSVALGRTKLASKIDNTSGRKPPLDKKPAAAVGQPGLMSLYTTLFGKYNIECAQVLVTETDIYQDSNRKALRDVLRKLLELKVIPILNTNDAVQKQPDCPCPTLCKGINLQDNDTLSAMLSVEIGADLLILLTIVDGLYDKPPDGDPNAKLLHIFSENKKKEVRYGKPNTAGLDLIGGMHTKVAAALWAVNQGTTVVVASGIKENSIKAVLSGKKFGTLFVESNICEDDNTEKIAAEARHGGRALTLVTAEQRSACINTFADLLDKKTDDIMAANKKDIDHAKTLHLSPVSVERLFLTPSKIKALSVGIRQVAESSKEVLGKVLKRTLLSDGLELQQISVPIGVLLVIFESRPDVLPQIVALAIASGNGIILKGGDEATHSNLILKQIADEALKSIKCEGAVGLVSTKQEIADLINMTQYIDLIIPRGGYQLIRYIQDNARRIPVMGHSAGICHIFVDKEANREKTLKIIKDAKTDYPSACNAVETILLHKDLMEGEFFPELCYNLKSWGVKINSGPALSKCLQFGPPLVHSMKKEYGSLELCIEVVNSVEEAVNHIDTYGSGHTESIITENEKTAEEFIKKVDSACVFHNASTRMSDGFRFGLGAEVGISTARIHARGPVGIEGLLTTKWILRSACAHTASEFNQENGPKWIHKQLPLKECK